MYYGNQHPDFRVWGMVPQAAPLHGLPLLIQSTRYFSAKGDRKHTKMYDQIARQRQSGIHRPKMSCFYPGSISVDYTKNLQIWLPILTLTFFAAMPILTDTGMSWDVRQFSVVPHISKNGARVVFRFGCHAPVPQGMPGDGKRPRRAPACS